MGYINDMIQLQTKHPLLPLGELSKKNAAFVVFYAEDCQPYLNSHYRDEAKNAKMTCMLMITRGNGSRGMIGGKLEEGETLKQALFREVEEEVGRDAKIFLQRQDDIGQVKHLCTHKIKMGFNSHLFTCKVHNYNHLAALQLAMQNEYDPIEVCGVDMLHLHDETINAFMDGKQFLARTVLEELEEMRKVNIF